MTRNSNGDGSVWQRKDGRWSGAAYVRTHTGKIERRYVYGKDEKDVLRKIGKLQEANDQGVPAGPTRLTVATFLGEWLEHARQHIRPHTWASYEANVRLHLVPLIGSKQLTALSVRDVRLMVEKLRKAGVTPRTVQWIHSTLRAALQHAFREELVTRNVARGVKIATPAMGTTPPPSSPDDARRFLAAVAEHRLYALWVVLIVLGLRRSEAIGLHWSDVDLDAGTLRITRGLQRVEGELRELPTKTRRSTRTVPLPRSASTCCASTATGRPRNGPTRAGCAGRIPSTCSPPASGRRWSRPTSPGCSWTCAPSTASAGSASTTCATPA